MVQSVNDSLKLEDRVAALEVVVVALQKVIEKMGSQYAAGCAAFTKALDNMVTSVVSEEVHVVTPEGETRALLHIVDGAGRLDLISADGRVVTFSVPPAPAGAEKLGGENPPEPVHRRPDPTPPPPPAPANAPSGPLEAPKSPPEGP